MSSTRLILVPAALFTLALGSAACGSRERAASAPGAESVAGAEGLKLRIKPGGQYFVADEPGALTAQQMAERIKREDPARFGRSIYILGDPGVVGYDVAIATNAASEAGFTRAAGIANYREDPSKNTRLDTWEIELRRPEPNTARDTAVRE